MFLKNGASNNDYIYNKKSRNFFLNARFLSMFIYVQSIQCE